MGIARLAIYLIGLVVVVAAAWIFLTQTGLGDAVPTSVALAVILLLVGIGIMASARSINDRREVRRVVHEGGGTVVERDRVGYPVETRRTEYDAPPARGSVVEERRYED